MTIQRRGAAAAAVSGKLYVCGGDTDPRLVAPPIRYEVSSSVERYDPRLVAWETLAAMSAPRAYAAAAAIAGRLHVFGGNNHVDCLDSVEQFDPAVGAWTSLPPMHARRSGAVAAAILG